MYFSDNLTSSETTCRAKTLSINCEIVWPKLVRGKVLVLGLHACLRDRKEGPEAAKLSDSFFGEQMAVTALVASINPSINPRQNSGTDSEEVQQLQHDLLQLIHQNHPEAMYPAALCALADIVEVLFFCLQHLE